MMSKISKREYLFEVKKKYWKATKGRKGQLLDDFCAFTGYSRKYATGLLNRPLPKKWKRYKPRAKYYDQPVVDALKIIWEALDSICGERVHPQIPEMLEKLINYQEIAVTEEVRDKLLKISLGSVKAILRKEKTRSVIRIGGTTKPGSLLKHQIAVRYGRWDEMIPGWCETDTVAHCGETVAGSYISSLDVVDICSSWSEQFAIINKGEQAVTKAMDDIKNRLPFKLLGLDPDNGAEFINWSLLNYCRKHQVNLTRSRPYHKNDNAHIEQKNWTAIRQLVGYSRFETEEQLNILNDLYANEWRLYINFFQPTMKLKEKIKDTQTGRTKKKYYEAKTPYQRLIEHPDISEKQKDMLKSIYKSLNPIKLRQQIKDKINRLKRTLK
jgi:hypothetical protein